MHNTQTKQEEEAVSEGMQKSSKSRASVLAYSDLMSPVMLPEVRDVSKENEFNTYTKTKAKAKAKTKTKTKKKSSQRSKRVKQLRNVRLKYKRKHYKWRQANWKRRFLGIFMASIQGVISGNCNTPFLWWQQQQQHNKDHYYYYGFSYFLGIYVGSTFMFMSMGLYKKWKRCKWKKPVTRPSFISGFMWGIGYISFLISNQTLSFVTVYVISQIGSVALSSLWSMFYFREIRQKRSLVLMWTSLSFIACGILCLALAELSI